MGIKAADNAADLQLCHQSKLLIGAIGLFLNDFVFTGQDWVHVFECVRVSPNEFTTVLRQLSHTVDRQWHVSASLLSKPSPTAFHQMRLFTRQIKEEDKERGGRGGRNLGGGGGVAGARSHSSVLAV